MNSAVRLRVLNVNDDPAGPGAIELRLVRGGHAVIRAQNTETVGRLIAICPVDLVIVDLWQPSMIAMGVCRAIRMLYRHGRVPIALVMSGEDEDLRATAHDAGVDELLCRPVQEQDLAAFLADVIQLRPRRGVALEPTTMRLQRVDS